MYGGLKKVVGGQVTFIGSSLMNSNAVNPVFDAKGIELGTGICHLKVRPGSNKSAASGTPLACSLHGCKQQVV